MRRGSGGVGAVRGDCAEPTRASLKSQSKVTTGISKLAAGMPPYWQAGNPAATVGRLVEAAILGCQ